MEGCYRTAGVSSDASVHQWASNPQYGNMRLEIASSLARWRGEDNLKNTDHYSASDIPSTNGAAAKSFRSMGRMIGKIALSVLAVLVLVGIALGIFFVSYIMGLKGDIDANDKIDLNDLKLDYTSFIYVMDSNGNPQEYQKLYGGGSNRIWVDFENIPKNMKNAMIAIEDRRFEDHNGVDWIRTIGATTHLFSQGSSYGGSTLTQQLIKNITGDNDVSITRKVTEIFRALRLEEKYTKQQILEAYLNVVNFGAGTKGVQAAANLYFGKNISECDLAECAAIAGITQNPYKYNPLQFPEQNKERQQIVLQAMLEQGKVSQSEFDQAMEKSEHMTFVGRKEDPDKNKGTDVFNWYTETMFSDLIVDLQNYYNCSAAEASEMIYYRGLKIYSAMDPDLQNRAETIFKNSSYLKNDRALQAGFFMMDYDGRVLAVVGSTAEKTSNRIFNYAIDAARQTGSTQKAISVYAPALEKGLVNYSSIVKDEPVPGWNTSGKPGPLNWDRRYRGQTTVAEALRNSLNAPAAWLCRELTPEECYKFLVQKLGFTHINVANDSHSEAAMSIGGLNGGATVREMTAAFGIFGNNGIYRRPYTYLYVEDHNGNVILDNRSKMPTHAISSANAQVMNKLLTYAVNSGTGTMARISGWEVFGKTGTTDSNSDSWFVGGTPYAVAGVWTGYKNPTAIKSGSVNAAKVLWRQVMTEYLKGKSLKKFEFNDVQAATFCNHSGLLASASCTSTNVGWYEKGKLPARCSAYHAPVSSSVTSEVVPNQDPENPGNPDSSNSVSSSGTSSSSTSTPVSSGSSPTSSGQQPSSTPAPVSSSSGGQVEPPAHGDPETSGGDPLDSAA